ncbi:MAG TPA: cupin domain-containing protein, partial [Opitutales bacterium]|nr:cupin domain-containing protein [Opitutales bacterium]
PASPHVFPLGQTTPQFSNEFGTRTTVNRSNFPILNGMALYHLILKPGSFREPHWHPNANELAYCTQGEALVTVFSNGNVHDCFTIKKDEMFFVPNGYLHAIENTGKDDAQFVIAFSHHAPEDFGMSGAVGCLNANVMGNTWALPEAAAKDLRYSPKDSVIGRIEGTTQIPKTAGFANHYKMPVKSIPPLVATEYGSATTLRKQFWPILDGISMYALHLKGTGMREPHWHPQTAEMGYVQAGNARMTILSPGGKVDTYELSAGDMYFIPKAYPHHIENLNNDELRFLIFFDQDMPQDIGYTGALAAYPRNIVAPMLGCTEKALPPIPPYPSDLFIVQKVNPVRP